jgi:predicted RNA-binding protein with TRAM domain
VRAEYCRISWEKPEDDGGTEITGYTVNLLDLSQGEWVTVAEPTSLTAEIKNLRPGHLYRVEVFANNKEGASPPTRLKDPVKAENPYTSPGVPTDVNIVDFDEQSVTLRWCKPTTDGGRPISHYIIQKKDEFGGWFEALITDNDNCFATIAELEARVPGLSLGKKYQFRVVACTKAGDSEPSQETKPHLCRYKNLAPGIDKGAAGSKMVKMNRLTCFQIKVKGEPAPSFTWTKEGKVVEAADGVVSKTVVEHPDPAEQSCIVTLQLLRTQMEDAGKFTLTATNKNGTDQVDLDLIVLDDVPVCDCDMFLNGSLECTCNNRFRAEEGDKNLNQIHPSEENYQPSAMNISSNMSSDLHGVVGGKNIGLKPNSDFSILTESVRRNVDVMVINAAKIH